MLGSSPAADLQRAAAELARSDDYYIDALLALERAESLQAIEAVTACDAVAQVAEQREYGGIAMKARLLAARAALHAGDTASAVARWTGLQSHLGTLQPTDCSPVTPAAIGFEILHASGQRESAATLIRAGSDGSGRSRCRRYRSFRDSFLHRNPLNRALLTAESRLR
jgi:hypothetical protein